MTHDKLHQIECPACRVVLPMPTSVAPTGSNLSTTFDESFIDEHMQMHANCRCVWMDGQRQHNPACPVHGSLR